MQIHYQFLEHDEDHVAWVQCETTDLDKVKTVFPDEEYEMLVAISPNYDPLTCDTQTLYNPPSPTWGVDIRKRTHGRHTEVLVSEDSQ